MLYEIMKLTTLTSRRGVFSMTINITPEDEKLIHEKLRTGAFRNVEEVIHRALVSLPTPETSPQPVRPFRNLVDVLSGPPFAGSELSLERIRDYPRPLDL
jgi:hypothetical protein